MHLRTIGRLSACSLLMAAVVACDDDPVNPGPMNVSIEFAALVNGAAFSCGDSYTGVGSSDSEITPVDFRFYVHDVVLIQADGTEAMLEMTDDGAWQRDGLALLDFENASGPCVNGTLATNGTVDGTVPTGSYTGIRFTLGVPEDLNHIDQTTAAPPQDLTSLFWSWNGGYKFARIDHTSDDVPTGWNVHLGSTGCTPTGDPTVPATSCSNQHRPVVEFSSFDWETQAIAADYGSLLAGSDLSQNIGGAPGCMSFPGDPDCAPVMNRFGLSYEGSASSGQTLFTVN